jgi:hypothetical protein
MTLFLIFRLLCIVDGRSQAFGELSKTDGGYRGKRRSKKRAEIVQKAAVQLVSGTVSD